jgi:hypothetical protein
MAIELFIAGVRVGSRTPAVPLPEFGTVISRHRPIDRGGFDDGVGSVPRVDRWDRRAQRVVRPFPCEHFSNMESEVGIRAQLVNFTSVMACTN